MITTTHGPARPAPPRHSTTPRASPLGVRCSVLGARCSVLARPVGWRAPDGGRESRRLMRDIDCSDCTLAHQGRQGRGAGRGSRAALARARPGKSHPGGGRYLWFPSFATFACLQGLLTAAISQKQGSGLGSGVFRVQGNLLLGRPAHR